MHLKFLLGLLCVTLPVCSSAIPALDVRDQSAPTFKTTTGASSCKGRDVNGLAREIKKMFDTTLNGINSVDKPSLDHDLKNMTISRAGSSIFNVKIDEPPGTQIVYSEGRDTLHKMRGYYTRALNRLMRNEIEVRCGGSEWEWKTVDPDNLPKGVSGCDSGYWSNKHTKKIIPVKVDLSAQGQLPKAGDDACYSERLLAIAMEPRVITLCDPLWKLPATIAEARKLMEKYPDGTKIDEVTSQPDTVLHEIMHVSDGTIQDKSFMFRGKEHAAYGIGGVRGLKNQNPTEVLHNAESFTVYAVILNMIPLVGGTGKRER